MGRYNTPPVLGISKIRPQIRVFLNAFLRIEAYQKKNYTARFLHSGATGLCFLFFLGLRYEKTHLEKLGFRLGPDITALSTCGCRGQEFCV